LQKTLLHASFTLSTVGFARSRRTFTTFNFLMHGVKGAAELGIYTLLFVPPARRAGGVAVYTPGHRPHHLMDQASCEN
jgi:hypothetical protein